MSRTTLALRVDLHTGAGISAGLPMLLETLERFGARATFFVALGPDSSARILRRALTHPAYLAKLLRLRSYRIQGIKELVTRMLLPAPLIGELHSGQLQGIRNAGHEIGICSWDPLKWQDYLPWFPKHLTAMELGKAAALFEELFGRRADATAAAGWMVSPDSLEVQDAMGLSYCSDCYGSFPFYPVMGGRRFRTLQIPVTLAPPDELLGRNGVTPDTLHEYYAERLTDGLNVLNLPAELTGGAMAGFPERLLKRLNSDGVRCIPLGEVFGRLSSVPACELSMEQLPFGTVRGAVQGKELR